MCEARNLNATPHVAADLEGRSMTDFVLHSAEAAAERTIEERAMLILSARETQAFVDAILNPAEPGPVLRAAARRFKATSSPHQPVGALTIIFPVYDRAAWESKPNGLLLRHS